MAKVLIGIVASNKTDKTIVVSVTSSKTHPLYKKQYSRSKRFMAHDEKNEAEVGDKVAIIETRPLSANKRHRLQRIIEKPVIREITLGDEELKAEAAAKLAAKKTADEAKNVEVEETPAKPVRRTKKVKEE